MLDPHFKAMIEAAAEQAANAPPLDAVPPAMIRMGYQMQRKASDQNPPQDVTAKDLEVGGAAGPIPARLYTPGGAKTPSGGLIYFHGGGFTIGDLETHDGHCRRLASLAGVRVLAIDYRLAPEHPFPAGHDDALAATKWAFDHAAELGIDPARIAVGGDSAGGNLAASVAIDLKDDVHASLEIQAEFQAGRGHVFFPPVREVWIERRQQGHAAKEDKEKYKADFQFQAGVHCIFPGPARGG